MVDQQRLVNAFPAEGPAVKQTDRPNGTTKSMFDKAIRFTNSISVNGLNY